MIRTLAALALLLVVSAASACGDDDGGVITPTSSSTATPTPTLADASPRTDWTTYSDTSGVTFPIPSGLASTESQTPILLGSGATIEARTITFLNADGQSVLSLSVAPNPENLSLEEWIQTVPGWPGESTSIQISGGNGLLFEQDQVGDANATVYFAEGDTVFGLRGNTGTTSAGSQGPVPPTMPRDDFDFIVEGLSLN